MKQLLIALLLLPIMSFAQPDLIAGKEKAQTCSACHGVDGNSSNGLWPKLAGQHSGYLIQQLKDFKEGKTRTDPSMAPMVATLSSDDMINLANYYSSQTISIETASKSNLALGARLYRAGDYQKKITACIACHGPQGLGNAQAGFPRLSGQHAQYLITQLKLYKSGKRRNDLNHIMRDIAKNLSDNDMSVLANYISGLH